MALEGKDINDSDILGATSQMSDESGTKIQFTTVLPSGRKLESEFFPIDMKRKAMVAWLDVVRQSRIDDAETVRAEARRKSEELKRGSLDGVGSHESALIASQTGAVTSTITERTQSSALSTSVVATSPPYANGVQALSTSPLEFAKQAQQRAVLQLQEIDAQLLQLFTRQADLTAQVTQWTTVLTSLGVAINAEPKPSSVDSVGSGSSRKRRSDIGVRRAKRPVGVPIIGG